MHIHYKAFDSDKLLLGEFFYNVKFIQNFSYPINRGLVQGSSHLPRGKKPNTIQISNHDNPCALYKYRMKRQ